MGRIPCSVGPDAGTLICAVFRTAAAVKNRESHALSFHSNLFIQILLWWDWLTTTVNFFPLFNCLLFVVVVLVAMIHFGLLCPVWTLDTLTFVWKEINRNVLNAYGFRHCAMLRDLEKLSSKLSKLVLLVQEPPQESTVLIMVFYSYKKLRFSFFFLLFVKAVGVC